MIEREIDREEEKDGYRERQTETECNGNLKNVCIFGERRWSE